MFLRFKTWFKKCMSTIYHTNTIMVYMHNRHTTMVYILPHGPHEYFNGIYWHNGLHKCYHGIYFPMDHTNTTMVYTAPWTIQLHSFSEYSICRNLLCISVIRFFVLRISWVELRWNCVIGFLIIEIPWKFILVII